MKALMMDYDLTIPAILRRAESLFADKSIVSRLPDRSLHRYTYADLGRRARSLAVALKELGVQPGDRVATLAWNHHQHLEAYFGVPLLGAVVHTLNIRLSGEDLAYIVRNAGDKVLLVDEVLLPVLEKFRANVSLERIVVMAPMPKPRDGMLDYETLLASSDPSLFEASEPDENDAAAMCYSSGTTGRPKGVLYSHRAIALHSMASAMVDTLAISEGDVVLPVVPMFHVNAWGLPYTCALVGAAQVLPGPYLDGESLLDLFAREQVTFTAGVPTIWFGILAVLDKTPDRWALRPGLRMVVGGSAAPRSLIERFDKHGLRVIHAWGMTETTPLGSVAVVRSSLAGASEDERYAVRAKQGLPVPFVEVRARGESGLVPHDGVAMGELEVRGPWVAGSYFSAPEEKDRFTEDGWFKTGDVVSIDPAGYIDIQDRSKDLIKSGGEWISSVALENALMGHPAVAEAAVIAAPHPKWQERPLAVVVLKEGQRATEEELLDFLRPTVAKFWVPDAVVFTDSIPRTATGKFLKSALRERYQEHVLTTA
ncbi:MAG: long-chain fatty acid--CoA ligase [Chloroflexota bacterium]|nr:long-chain fatty acid--CoA ligase [Chloroflexota bacterium]